MTQQKFDDDFCSDHCKNKFLTDKKDGSALSCCNHEKGHEKKENSRIAAGVLYPFMGLLLSPMR